MIENYQIALLELIKASLFNTKPSLPDNIDWDAVYKEALDQTVVALASEAVPTGKAGIWQETALQNTAHYMRVLFEQSNLIRLFNDAEIPLVIIKGSAAAMYYPVPRLRAMGDIDFLVTENNFKAARELLDKNGYVFNCDYEDGRDFSYTKGGVVFELHRRYSDSRLDIEDIITSGMSNTELHELNGHQFPTFSADINGLILLDHIRHHIYGGLGIRQIIDYMMFIKYCRDRGEDMDGFLELVKKANLFKFCKTVTKLCVVRFGLPADLPWCGDADDDTVEQLLSEVLKSGNFGRKDPYVYRPVNSLSQSVHKEGLFKVLQQTGLANWKAAQRHKFLRPFAWLYQALRYIKRGISALLRGENLKKDMDEGNKKAIFYENLGI